VGNSVGEHGFFVVSTHGAENTENDFKGTFWHSMLMRWFFHLTRDGGGGGGGETLAVVMTWSCGKQEYSKLSYLYCDDDTIGQLGRSVGLSQIAPVVPRHSRSARDGTSRYIFIASNNPHSPRAALVIIMVIIIFIILLARLAHSFCHA
jgi:hypothetical protein